ncbi:E3 ubiquitin protein ligase RIN2 [Physcomitrium patens]|uniref:RING-type domain-containing protein n=2 Tax=Physcomitrium patens TaxID=3218 RepID=A9SFR3_PHYPA|nr:E3 ubiquitin protein ligase RIN2-like [Physcomitrium patens]PNR57231.1 hypothetical protein PHYPA_004224 [Physcomitrium patens]|eukprot:XP_024371352.1 E3 ubiquitin protein ligase RIN2-like [Physcomitrella patens]
MGVGYGPVVALYTALSLSGIAWKLNSALRSTFDKDLQGLDPIEADRTLQALLQSSVVVALLANLMVNCFLLITLSMKTIFFGQLSLVETQKVVERLINYVLFKGLFLTWVVRPEMMQIAVWLAWFSVLGFLKMFLGLARDRLERLNASPSATVFSHLRIYAVLLFVLLFDLLWMHLCLLLFKDIGTSTFLLLLFEPLSIASDTLQAVIVHGMQLMDTWQRQSLDVSAHDVNLQPSERSAAGAAWEWRGTVVRNCSFVMDIVSLLLALGHCVHIWWLRGLAFQVVDAILFLNLRALLSAISKRIKGFMRLRTAMTTLQGALPDATQEQLLAYEDDCAICKEPMARAKRLPCAHLFHLPCLRSWLDQGLAETYSCPTCRRPLFMGGSRTATQNLQRLVDAATTSPGTNETQAQVPQRQDLAPLASPPLANLVPPLTPHWNAPVTSTWTGTAEEVGPVGVVGGIDEANRSTDAQNTGGGLGRLHLMMRQLSGSGSGPGLGHSHGHGLVEESNWNWWPFGGESSVQSSRRSRDEAVDALLLRNNVSTGLGTVADPRISAMVGMVREVLPHVPDELIAQDLLRTNSVTATVNNFL